MVFFVCEVCQESIKKSKVDTHLHKCPQCWTLVCVDCGKEFHGEEYRQHNTCITEAEKYQKSVYQPKKGGKLNAADLWNEGIRKAAAEADPSLSRVLGTLVEASNVPRKLPKFLNFAKNSLRGVRQDVLTKVFDVINKAATELREQQEAAAKAAAEKKKKAAAEKKAKENGSGKKDEGKKKTGKKGNGKDALAAIEATLKEEALAFSALESKVAKRLKRPLEAESLKSYVLLHKHIEADGDKLVWVEDPSKRLRVA